MAAYRRLPDFDWAKADSELAGGARRYISSLRSRPTSRAPEFATTLDDTVLFKLLHIKVV